MVELVEGEWREGSSDGEGIINKDQPLMHHRKTYHLVSPPLFTHEISRFLIYNVLIDIPHDLIVS
jgi:hypothetical protein